MVPTPLANVVPLLFDAMIFTVPFALRALKLGAAIAGHHDLMQTRIIVRELFGKFQKKLSYLSHVLLQYSREISMSKGYSRIIMLVKYSLYVKQPKAHSACRLFVANEEIMVKNKAEI